ncbi:MAG: hypothetical protein ABL958_06410 [Bdellovibrionia bacterium]
MKSLFALCLVILSFGSAGGAPQVFTQTTPDGLGEMWIAAIKSNTPDKIKGLIHPKCPKAAVTSEILKRMVSGPLPTKFELEAVDLGEQDVLRKIYAVLPEKQLNLKYVTKNFEERQKFGLGKGFPIGRIDGKWYFIVCARTAAPK